MNLFIGRRILGSVHGGVHFRLFGVRRRRRGLKQSIEVLEDVALRLLGLRTGVGLGQLLRGLLGIADDALENFQRILRLSRRR